MWRGRSVLILGSILACCSLCCQRQRPQVPVRYTYQVVGVIPHRPDAFTQGLAMDQGVLFEGTGLYGRSCLSKLRPDTGEVIGSVHLPVQFFGEGIAILAGKLYQLTWQEGKAFVYDRDTLDLIGTFHYRGEGWGLTSDGKVLILSDGSSNLSLLDPNSFEVIKTIAVHDHEGPVARLNELESVNGYILANIWQEALIAVIDPQEGTVIGYIDISDLWSQQPPGSDVPNGIAYDLNTGELLVTGKLWHWIYRLRVVGPWQDSPKKVLN